MFLSDVIIQLTHIPPKEVTPIKILKGAMLGILSGAVSPIPGVSSGTLFVFFNIYEEFFQEASFENLKKNIPLLISFVIGTAIGIVGVSHIILHLLTNHAILMYFSFIGLILGCIPMIYKKATVQKVKHGNVTIFIVALSFMIFLTFTSGSDYANQSLEQLGGLTPLIGIWVFVASFISSTAMLIPGVGGSVMMLAFGTYTIYIEAISSLDPIVLPILLISMVLGILVSIKVIKGLLVTHPQTLYGAILGFMIGSVFLVFPGFSFNLEGFFAIVAMSTCGVFSYYLTKKEPPKSADNSQIS